MATTRASRSGNDCIAVVTTLASRDEARRIAQALVERGLVACAQISEIESFYRWDGAVQNEPEFRLLLKTVGARYGAVEQAIRALHPYELPAIYALPVDRAYPPYADWVRSGSSGVGETSDIADLTPDGDQPDGLRSDHTPLR